MKTEGHPGDDSVLVTETGGLADSVKRDVRRLLSPKEKYGRALGLTVAALMPGPGAGNRNQRGCDGNRSDLRDAG